MSDSPSRVRSFALATVLWIFGLSTSVLLVGLWGRSVATDETTLEAGVRAVLESQFVNERVNSWLVEGVSAASDAADPGPSLIDDVLASDRVQASMDRMVDEAVVAALTPPGETIEADVPGAVDGFASAVSSELASRGLPTDAGLIRQAALAAASGMIDQSGAGTVARSARQARSFLTRVIVVGLAGLLGSGWIAVRMSDDRVRQVRALATRLAVSGLTFAILLRVGGWAVDPSGGRSPLLRGGAVLLSSNTHIPVLVALLAGGVMAAAGVAVRRRRRSETGPDEDADTRELVRIG